MALEFIRSFIYPFLSFARCGLLFCRKIIEQDFTKLFNAISVERNRRVKKSSAVQVMPQAQTQIIAFAFAANGLDPERIAQKNRQFSRSDGHKVPQRMLTY